MGNIEIAEPKADVESLIEKSKQINMGNIETAEPKPHVVSLIPKVSKLIWEI